MKLSRVYREICLPLQEATGRPVVIAGGAVRDHLLGRKPRDYDVFVLSGKLGPPMVAKLVKDIRNHLLSTGNGGVAHVSFSVTSKYGGHNDLAPVAEFYFWGHKVQVIVSPVKDVVGLLNTFDYNICQLAYRDYKVVHHIWKVLPLIKSHGKLHVTGTTTNPALTLSRGYEFARRYGMKLPDDVVKTLCAQIVGTPTATEIAPSEAPVLTSTGETLTAEHWEAAADYIAGKTKPFSWYEHGSSYDKLAALILGGKL